MTRLSLVSADAEQELALIRQTLEVFENVSGLDDVIAVLHAYSKRGGRAVLLDVIGHSCSRGFLVIGTWVVDDSPQTAASFSELLRPSLKQVGVSTIRLLGCSTARTERGRNAMRRIAQVTGCDVLGTRRYISRRDYAPSGFASDDTLISADGARPV